MVSACLKYVVLLALCVLMLEASSEVDVPAEEIAVAITGEDADSEVEVPAGKGAAVEKRNEKRNGHYCNVAGHIFRHGEVFSYPGFSRCIKYRCDNGGYYIVQSACERRSQCVPEGSVLRENCRALRCVRENRGNMNYFHLEPTVDDECSADGDCVQKNKPFEHRDCNVYMCIPTPNGGYTFRRLRAQCKNDAGRCIRVGDRFSKVINGYRYYNCLCTDGGGYSCRG